MSDELGGCARVISDKWELGDEVLNPRAEIRLQNSGALSLVLCP